jgi:hypothetical protein
MSLLKISLTLVVTLAAGTPAFAADPPTSKIDVNQTSVIDGSNNSSRNSSYQTQHGRSGGSTTPTTSQKTDQVNDIQGNGNRAVNNSRQVTGGTTQRPGR